MKKIIVFACVFVFAACFKNASAQFQPTKNTAEQPKWGLHNQDYVEYYYLPDIDTYYYVPGKQFIYQSGGYWTFSSSLPAANKRYDLRSANKVVINEPGAYRYFAQHKAKYASSQSNASIQKDKREDKRVEKSKQSESGKTAG